MNYDTNIINQHIFSEGKIQLSPVEIKQLNAQPPVPFKAGHITGPANSGYKILLTGYASKIYQAETGHNTFQALDTGLNSLRSNPRSAMGFIKKGSVDTRSIDVGFYYIWYKVFSGQVLVYNIEPKDAVQRERDRQETVGVYKIKLNTQGVWESQGKTDTVTTSYAAVNGQSNNLTKATWLMGAHLEFEYGKSTIKEYTLFHNPSVGGPGDTWESIQDKMGFTTAVTKKFSELLQKTQKAEHKIKWVAHSQGGLIFAEAVRYHLNSNSSWAIAGGLNGALRKDKGESLSVHSVAFHGNANNNLRSSVLFDRAGIKVTAARANAYDMVNTIIGLNTVNPWRMVGSVVYANHVMGGTIEQSPHTLMHKDFNAWDGQMEQGPGKGRNTLQKSFNALDKAGRSGIEYIKNYLK